MNFNVPSVGRVVPQASCVGSHAAHLTKCETRERAWDSHIVAKGEDGRLHLTKTRHRDTHVVVLRG